MKAQKKGVPRRCMAWQAQKKEFCRRITRARTSNLCAVHRRSAFLRFFDLFNARPFRWQ
jgi:hypothetical protein